MKARKLNILLLLAVAATLVAIAVYEIIPMRSYSIIPSDWRTELFTTYAEGELDISKWVNKDAYHFRCEVQDSDAWQQCGMNLHFDWNFANGVDFSKYESMKINASYKGQAQRVRIFLRNFNPEYSSPDDANSAKFLSLNLLTSEFDGGNTVEIGFNEFVVADWWTDQHTLPRQLMPVEFGNITTLGFDFGTYLENVKEIDFAVHSLRFEGPLIAQEHWYLGILVFWMVAILLLVAYQYIQMLRSAKIYSKVITELVSDKANLQVESQKLQELSNLDRLTGALNRLGVEKSFDRIITGQRSRIIGLILIDVDHFKRINDQRGHDVGDLVLKAVVEIIQKNIREHDILGRWGGEEFVLIAPNADQQIAYRIGEKLRELIAAYTFVPENPLKVTASFGVTAIAANEDFEYALKRADIALYEAKSQGRNCTVIAKQEE